MSNVPLMSLGLFTFALQTAPFETVKRSTKQRWSANDRVGGGPAHQWLGPADDKITLDGSLMPALTGGATNLDKLRTMANSGKAWILVSGQGDHLGKWFIQSIEETRSHHAGPGLARRIEFTVKLVRYWGDSAQLGNLMDSRP
mgnify:CR=1 FL=1